MSVAPPPTGFLVLQGNRLEDLRDLVIEAIRDRSLPPLVPEVFLVQSNGMKHWLQQSLADEQAFGICAATQIELPSTFLWRAYRAVLGREAVPTQLVFDKDALTWRLLRLLPTWVTADPVLYAPLAHYLKDDGDGRRAWQLAQQVADVLDGYQQYRADWLAAWEQGDDSGVPVEHRWQPALWRALRADVGSRHENTSRAAVHSAFVDALGAWQGPRPAGVPPRLFVFGISSLPMQSVEALAQLGRVCQVIVAVQNPCQFYWGDIVEGRDLLKRLQRQRRAARAEGDPQSEAPPLLASLGKQGRDYLHLLDDFDQTETQPHQLPRVDWFTDPVQPLPRGRPATRLLRLQSAILNLEPLPPLPEDVPADDSIRFVQAHSAQREVEVLHDHLLALLDADTALRPSDIMVMVPDMTQFVSHIQAAFGRFDRTHPRHLPYSVADTSPRDHPLVKALERLLHLPDLRVGVTDWLSLFEVDALRRRFDLSESDVESLRDALSEALVRWGLDGAHRADHGVPLNLPGLAQNTWAAGLERLLLGYAVPGRAAWQSVLAAAGLSGLAAGRIGGLAAWIDAMRATLDALQEPKRPAQWALCLNALLDRFFDTQGDDEAARILQRLREQLDHWQALCETAGFDEAVPLLVVREHWLAAVEGVGLQQRFFGGGVQFATLMPMRSIPFKVVCLLGMNDGAYPRRTTPRDFDLMVGGRTPATRPRPGDRSRRDDDRYLFLEALLSARERLYVSWIGRRITDNAPLAPSVVVGQLRDELARRFRVADVPQIQPLQPFSREYFESAPGKNPAFRTYDADWQRVDAASLEDRVAGHGAADVALPEALKLEDLQRFVKQPVEAFWRQRLKVRLDTPDAALDEDEPFELDRLEEHQAKSDFIRDWQAVDEATARERLQLSGRLPLGATGERVLADLVRDANTVLYHAAPWRDGWPPREEPLAFDLAVQGLRVHGTVTGLRSQAGHWLQLELRPAALLRKRQPRFDKFVAVWVTQVCLEAAGHDVRTELCGPDTVLHIPPIGREAARRQLEAWVEAFREGWQAPLRVACRTALERLAPTSGKDTPERLEDCFDGDGFNDGERAWSTYLQRSFEGYADIKDGVERWAEPLYGRLVTAVTRDQAAPDAEVDE
jgi:exodeoxyribonuclease V gamma subunit